MLLVVIPFAGSVNAQITDDGAKCEMLHLSDGRFPYDYNDPAPAVRHHLQLVENAHFTTSVRQGIRGNTSYAITGDLVYVLNHFPNHPQALALMANHQLTPDFSPRVPGRYDYLIPTTACYFKRALQIAPNDPAVYLVMAIHQHKQKQHSDAESSYKKALQLSPDYTEAHYNLGLLYTTTGQYELALKHAHIAYRNQYPLPGLRAQLTAKGQWREPAITD